MKKGLIFAILMLLLVTASAGDSLRENLFGTDSAPSDTIWISNGQTKTTRTIYFKNPHKIDGALFLFGYAKKVTGTADSIFVEFRRLNDRYTSNYENTWHRVDTLVPGDSASYRVDISNKTWWDYCDGYQARFIGAAGSFTYRLQSIGKSR